jgi:hypothetical protein
MYRGQYIEIPVFSGGYAGNLPATRIQPNQAKDLDNIVIRPGGLGFRTRLGNDIFGIATKVVQDITYTAVTSGSAGTEVSVAYVAGGTAGAEVVTVTGSAISIQIEDGVSTATQVKAKFDASTAAVALASAAITGTAGTAQVAATAVKLAILALNSSAAIQGIGYLRQADQDQWLVTIAGAKIYKSDSLDEVWDDITDTYAGITAGAANKWSFTSFNDKIIGFGGPPNDPNAAIVWTGTGNVAALTGAPAAYGGFSANNRVFAFRTKADPSSIFWTVIGDPEDWSGAGSGNATIGSLSDNQTVTAAIMISTNYVLVFKENSVHQMVISSAPFPVYSLFSNIGTPGKNSVVNVDGTVYFITSLGEMRSTDGESIKSYPEVADDLWDSVSSVNLKNVVGWREKTEDKDWLVWAVTTTGTTNNLAIIWDLRNQCWLKCSTGYTVNVIGSDESGKTYLGSYGGYVFTSEKAGRYYDAITDAAITAYWRSGWISPENIDKTVRVRKFGATVASRASGNLTVHYGFDGIPDARTFNLSQISTTQDYKHVSSILSGRGNTFQFKLGHSSKTIDAEVHSILLSGKSSGQKGQDED